MRITRTVTLAAAAALGAGLLGAGTAQAAPAKPDLVVTSVAWAPQAVAAGQQLTFRAVIKNRGTAPTPAGVVHGVGFQVDGKLRTWSDNDTSSLAPGESTTVYAVGGPTGSSTWTATAGSHEILAFVDDAARIAESDEGNNRTKTTFTVTARPTVVTGASATGRAVSATLSKLAQKTGLASSVSGSAYASCVSYDAQGKEVSRPGTETYIGEYGAGSFRYGESSPFSWSGVAEAPAGVTSAGAGTIDPNSIRKYNYGTPSAYLTCRDGESATFTRLHATKVTVNRWQLTPEGWSTGVLLGTYTGPVNTDLTF
ncbi:CARDB domain-containing protein [Kineococcus rhizosphaerae]|uniref:CARDB protein n=1 Tax=Kineococcus rhizosphaerae TaxID=559628 RepID=A0A2T0R201_9ACTN|nr:CARDB domain-containing protein [Kineococcus rhizosphaerae]PRY13592.1 CARDB protein [Kineococcus rhizosphaerae]